IGSANDGIFPDVPGEPATRLEICDAVVLVVQGVAVVVRATMTGEVNLSTDGTKVGLTDLDFVPARVKLPAQADVERQVRTDVPVVLVERGKDVPAVSPGTTIYSAANVFRHPHDEVRFRDAAVYAAGRGQRIGSGRIPAGEVERPRA